MRVKLSDIFDAIDFQMEESVAYLNKNTGEIVPLMQEELRAAEDGDSLEDCPAWQQELIERARDVVEHLENYLALPTQYDIHEYRIMEKFCLSIEDQRISKSLYHAKKGRGAFRRFKDELHRLGIQDDWYEYRKRALIEIAKEWCELHKIQYINE